MPLKNGNTVGVERRMDLASLFCMIGRHGPAVALAVIAMVSMLAGFIIYRTVRGKRRKATEAAAADGEGESPGAERDASVVQPSPEDSHSSVESTDASDEGSTEVREDADLKLRHRRAAAAEKTPPRYSPPKSDIQEPANKDPTSNDSYRVTETHAEEANQSLQTCTEAEMRLEDAVDCHQWETEDAVKDVLEEFHTNSCLKEPEPINDENHEEEEKVLISEGQEEEDVITDNDVSDETTREQDDFQCALNNPVCFQQTPHMSENTDNDGLQDDKSTNSVESNSEEPVIHIEDLSVPCVCYGKDEEFEEDNPDSIDFSSYSASDHLSSEKEKKNDSEEAEEECLDNQLTDQQSMIWSSTSEQETNVPSTQQEQCDHVMDKVTKPSWGSDWDEDGGLAGEEDLDKLTAVKSDAHAPQFVEQDVAIEPEEENGLTCVQGDGVLYDGVDQVTENILTGDDIVACSEERDSSSVTLSPALVCLTMPVKTDNHDDDPSRISGIANLTDLTLHCQNPQKEAKADSSLQEDTKSTILSPEMPSHETENQPENYGNGTTVVLAEERNDQWCDLSIQSCYKDQKDAQTTGYEAFAVAGVAAVPDIGACDGEYITTLTVAEVFDRAADPDTVENIPSVIVEEISFPHLTSICQDQQIDHVDKNEIFDETEVNSATDASACNDANLASPMMSEEPFCPDMFSFTQDQQSDQTENDFCKVTTGASPVMNEDINYPVCQIHLPSFEQFELRDNDLSSAGVGEESGISSMNISPDAGNDFDVIFENMVPPVMDCDLQSEEQTEVRNNLFADDAAISVIKENTAGMVFGPFPSRQSQAPYSEPTGWTNFESLAANEDKFGHEIEDSYHRAMDQFAAQIADSLTSFTDELGKQSDVKVVVGDVEFKKKAGVSVEKKEETKAENEKEEDYEKTEISIMEATMDHNEWIMDTNYQALPWMSLSATSFAQDHSKTNQLPTEESQYSCAVTDTTCIGTISPPTESKQTSDLSLVDESTENKKVVAVQPMHQSVNVTFRIHYFTQSPYQTVAVTGNQPELGSWKGFVPLERAKDGHWVAVVSLPTESLIEWKFVVVDKGEVCRWEECGNRLLDTGYGEDLVVHKWWGRL